MRGSSFFEGVRQVDVEIAGRAAKVPVFYYDTTAMTAVFPARLRGLRALMPDPSFEPARLAPGVGLLGITAFQYRDTDLGPYDELGVFVVLNEPSAGRANLPGRALADALLRPERRHVYVAHLPVTTQVALRAGVDFYNFPKFIADIDFGEERGRRSCRLAEGREHILTLTADPVETAATPEGARTDDFCHLYMDGQPQLAHVRTHDLEKGTCWRPGAARLALGGRHPVARELDRLLLSRRSVQYELAVRSESILFGPEHLTLPLLLDSLEAARAGSAAASG